MKSKLRRKKIPHNMTPGANRIILRQQPAFTWLVAMGLPELFLTHSSTIFTTARRIFGSGDFSMREVRMTWMKFFLISIFMTDSLSFTRSKLSMTNSLVTIIDKEEREHDYMTVILFLLSLRFTGLLWFSKPNKEEILHAGSHTQQSVT